MGSSQLALQVTDYQVRSAPEEQGRVNWEEGSPLEEVGSQAVVSAPDWFLICQECSALGTVKGC